MNMISEVITLTKLKKSYEERHSKFTELKLELFALQDQLNELSRSPDSMDKHRRAFVERKYFYLLAHLKNEQLVLQKLGEEVRFKQTSPVIRTLKKVDKNGNKIIYTIISLILASVFALILI